MIFTSAYVIAVCVEIPARATAACARLGSNDGEVGRPYLRKSAQRLLGQHQRCSIVNKQTNRGERATSVGGFGQDPKSGDVAHSRGKEGF